MKINLVTQNPDIKHLMLYFCSISKLISKSLENKIIDLNIISTYDYDKYPDDSSFAGTGMCLKYSTLQNIFNFIPKQPIFNLSPDGVKLTNELIDELIKIEEFSLISSRYEGVDERFINNFVTCNISIGDFVLSNGDIAASVLIDSILRKKGMVKPSSLKNESFVNNRLDHAVYTKPRNITTSLHETPFTSDNVVCKKNTNIYETSVPEVLFSGNHKLIDLWRKKYSLFKTLILRPDIINKDIDDEEKKILKDLINKINSLI